MNEAKHTPSPWWVDDFGNGDVRVVVDPVKGMPPPICDGRTFVCKLYQQDERGIDAKANARLIAAAPELLEASMKVLEWFEAEDDHSKADFYQRMQMWRDAEEMIRAAITKATGGAE